MGTTLCALRLVRLFWLFALALALFLGPSSWAAAQSAGSATIQGKATDETGGAVPGVTVTVKSPALQLPELGIVTDGSGNYRFVDLPPGIYRIAYELPGFQSVIREEVRLNAGFVARIDVVLKVGAIAENVTVSGKGPVVDVSTTAGSTNFTKETLDSIPAVRTMWQVLALTPGVRVTSSPDVGGSTVGTQQDYTNYGTSAQNKPEIEGIDTREFVTGSGAYYDDRAFEEVQVRPVGNDAEMALPGTNYVGIVKSGGNEFHGSFLSAGEWPGLESGNLDDKLRSQGVRAGNPLRYYYDLHAELGGRLVRDKLWFYTAYRNHKSVRRKVDYSKAPGPDGVYGTQDDEPGQDEEGLINYTGKFSYQPAKTFKAIAFVQRGIKRLPERDGSRFRPRENAFDFWFTPWTWKGELQGTPSNKVLWNVLVGRHGFITRYDPVEDIRGKPTRFDRATGRYTGPAADLRHRIRRRWMSTGSMSLFPGEFFAGDHAFKVGYRIALEWYGENRYNRNSGNYILTYDTVGGVPFQPVEITTYNLPISGVGSRMTEYSGYVKDTWRVGNRLTLNLGARWERYHSFVEEQTKEQGIFGGSGTFPAVNVLTWVSAAPRAGVAYDVSGDGRTVFKATYGWYNHTMGEQFADNFNQNLLLSATYRWRDLDRNSDYSPGEVNLDLNGSDFINIAGARNNILNRDLSQPKTTEISAGVERELIPNFAARALYVYKAQRNLYEPVNVLRPYSAYTIPLTRRDPGPDGILGTGDDAGSVTFYDYHAAYRGAQFVGRKILNRNGRDDAYHTIEFTLNKRMSDNWDALASFSATRSHRWLDGIPESPNDEFFPLDETWGWQVKAIGSYAFRYGIRFAGFVQHLSGNPDQRTYIFRRLDPDGGPAIQQLSTVTLRLEPFGQRREPNINLLNLRASKGMSLGKGRYLDLEVDLFNVLNANTASDIRYESGLAFGAISRILPPRIVRLGATVGF